MTALQIRTDGDACRWPPQLHPPYDEALRQAVRFILARFDDVLGIVVAGSVLRGVGSPSSDLDIYVIRERTERQRLQHFFNGVPAEIFVNPPQQVRAYLEKERRAGRPITAHMLVTGFVVLALDPVVGELQDAARRILQQKPDFAEAQVTAARYMAATAYEDALDVVETRPETAQMILAQAVFAMVRYWFVKENRYLPRYKDLLNTLDELEPELARLARTFYSSAEPATRLALAARIADVTIETYGFFEWESPPEELG